jgi:hypothetical protein
MAAGSLFLGIDSSGGIDFAGQFIPLRIISIDLQLISTGRA